VFFEGHRRKDNPGFDVVIGNPPYINVAELLNDEREFLMNNLETALKRFDIYIGFIEKGYRLLRDNRWLGFIIPYPFLSQDYGENLRKLLLRKTLLSITDVHRFRVFEDPAVRNVIIVFSSCADEGKALIHEMNVLHVDEDPNKANELLGITTSTPQSVYVTMPAAMIRLQVYGERAKVVQKIQHTTIPLGKITVASWGARGIPTSQFHHDKPINNKCKKMLRGNVVERFGISWSGTWLLYDLDSSTTVHAAVLRERKDCHAGSYW
jgi:hypothetical protein